MPFLSEQLQNPFFILFNAFSTTGDGRQFVCLYVHELFTK